MDKRWEDFIKSQTHKNAGHINVVSKVATDKLIANSTDGQRYLNLSIQLNSWSPIYETPWGDKYKEKLSPTIFTNQGEISKLQLNSYVDHDISIEKLIASTKDGSMIVSQEGNTITASIKETNDPLLQKVINLVERGIITSNSFIFRAKDVSYTQHQSSDKDKNPLMEIVYNEGELISIDPVYQGFYPQDKIEVLTKEATMPDTNIQDIIDNEEIINETETKEVIDNEEVITKDINTQEVIQKSIEDISKIDTKEIEKTKIQETVTLRSQPKDMASRLLSKSVNESKTIIDLGAVKSKWLQKQTLSQLEKKALTDEFDKLSIEQKEEISLALYQNKRNIDEVKETLTRSLDGSTSSKGLVLIEVLTNPKVLSEMQIVFPELTAAVGIMPLVGLNEVKQTILIANSTMAQAIAEGASSNSENNQMTKVLFKPIRYSEVVSQNNQLNNYAQVFEKQTILTKNSILRALRNKFYQNLLTNINADLKLEDYTGGATKEAIVKSPHTDTVTWEDLELIYKRLVDLWGDTVKDKYTISMHVDTLTQLENSYFDKPSVLIAQLYDPINRKYRGIHINATSYYPVETGNVYHPVIFYLKEAVMVYGCSMLTIDDPITKLSEDQTQRFVRTRGEIKMCDPNLNTRVLEVTRTKATAKEDKKNTATE